MDVFIPYKPYWYQSDFEIAMQTKKRAVLCWARRHGKDLACWNHLIFEALSKKGNYFYIFPEYAQARKALWDAITENGLLYLDFIPREVISRRLNNEMKLYLRNGSIIQVLGSDNFDAIRGTNPIGVVLSEYAYQNPNIWTLILDPIFSKNKGWCVFNSTPHGKNHFFDLYSYAQEHVDEYFHSFITNEHTKIVSLEEIEKKKAQGISDEVIQQEYYCSFDIGVRGSYYGKVLREMHKENRICNVPYDKNLLVYTAWDLGFTDSMSIVFFQKRGNEILIIDFYENQGYQLSHYLQILRSKEYTYGKHFVPFDAKSHSPAGSTFIQIAKDQNFDFTVLSQQKSIIEGIEKVRGYFPRFYLDKEKCDYLVRCLLQYHADYDEKWNVFKNIPRHDWSSHAADALRYMVQALAELMTPDMSKEELNKLKKEANYPYL